MNSYPEPISNQPDIARTTFAVLVIGLLIVSTFWVLSPFLGALVWAAMITIATWPLLLRLQEWCFGKRSWAVAIMTVALLLVLFIPLTMASVALVNNIGVITDQVNDIIKSGIPDPPRWLRDIPLIGSSLAEPWQRFSEANRDEIVAKVGPYIGVVLAWILKQFGNFGLVFLQFILVTILCAVLYAQGESAARFLIRFSRRLGGQRGEYSVILAGQAIRAVALGVVVTALIQSAMAALGFLFAGVPHALILALICFFLGVIQIGSGPVLVIVTIWLFFTASVTTASMFLLWALITMSVDNFIRPILIKRGADLPLLLIFAGVIGGLISFGVVGLFVGPVVLALAYTLINAWVDETSAPST